MVGTGGKVCILASPEALKTHFLCSWKANIKKLNNFLKKDFCFVLKWGKGGRGKEHGLPAPLVQGP